MSNKLRNADGDTMLGFAQWLGRKIRNHGMLAELDTVKAGSLARSRDVSIVVTPGAHVVLCQLADGKMFEIQVREVRPAAYAKAQRIAVGY